ncbi:putative DUF4303 family protein [Corynebacterium mustelae]|uniref:Putative DUF4303 family protein n=1 Tax=Corynebacterium mustelae TaxID=571915 RepID=A0A0G3H305_9CORY|nr:DUF4303 domain-containing protein [Corynebacterium mustelae]AKK05522.1 putative DUF4303 family protein [Corynebacterium mustelae]
MSVVSEEILRKLQEQISSGVVETLRFVLHENNPGEVFTYALYTDDYCSYVGWAANTLSHFEKKKAEFPDSRDHAFVQWYYPEFFIGTGEAPAELDNIFNEGIQKALDEAQGFVNEDNFPQFQSDIYDSIIGAFGAAIHQFDQEVTDAITFFVSIADSDDAENLENYSAEKLNSAEKYAAFQKRYDN